jgi:signal transduction histidine kinase
LQSDEAASANMVDDDSDFGHAIARGRFGFALLDDRLCVLQRRGDLVSWLPDEGQPAYASSVFLNMRDSLTALQAGGELALPALRIGVGEPIALSVAFDPDRRRYLIIATPDHSARQADRLALSQRRKMQLLEQQAAVASERLRIAHDLHDTLGRSLVTVIAEMRLIAKKTADSSARDALTALERKARAGLKEVRETLARMRSDRPAGRDARDVVKMFRKSFQNVHDVYIAEAIDADLFEVPEEIAQTICSVLREALRNVELHSGSKRIEVALRFVADGLRLDVIDDGRGFDSSAEFPGHYGLVGMREQAALIGARLEILSAPGEGARVTLVVPSRAE